MSDSTIHARFTVTTKIAKATDNESSRYALGNVLLTPADNGVFLTATDGRQLSVAHCEGETDSAYAVPSKAIPTANGGGSCELNGMWRTTTGKRSPKTVITDPKDAYCGRFPRAADCIPETSTATHDVLIINVDLLRRLADSIEAEKEPVTLLIPKADEHGIIDDPIAVLGGTGFGVICPAGIGVAGSKRADRVAEKMNAYNEKRSEYARHFTTVTV